MGASDFWREGPGAGTFLIANPFVNNVSLGIDNVDLTTNPPTLGTLFAKNGGANYMTFGPDGCIYAAQLTTVFKITDYRRQLQLCFFAGVSDAGAVANLSVAESGARNVANLRCDAALCDCPSGYAGCVQHLGSQPAD